MNQEIKKEYSDCPCCGDCCDNPKRITPEHECSSGEEFCEECYCTECENCGKYGCDDL